MEATLFLKKTSGNKLDIHDYSLKASKLENLQPYIDPSQFELAHNRHMKRGTI